MKKLFLLKTVLLLCALIVGSLNGWAETATITFTSASGGDSSTALTTSNFVSNGIASSDAAFGTISCSATAKCYNGKSGYGLKAGASSNAGSFTISFSTALANVSQITLNRASYSDSKTATITVKNGSTTLANAVSTPSGSAAFDNMNITGLSIASLAGLTVETSKYCYIKSITITYSPSSDPSISADDVELASDDTYGEISYSITNPKDGATLEASSVNDWISNIDIDEDNEIVTFVTTANDTSSPRVGTVTLKYMDGDDELDSKDVTITQAKAVIMYNYTLATKIVPGKHYIITNGTDGAIQAMGEQRTNNRGVDNVTATTGTISVSSEAIHEFLIEGDISNGYYTIYDAENSGYLYAASSSNNYLKVQKDLNENGEWQISIDKGVATIIAQGTYTHNLMRYNSSSSIFSCYESNQNDIYLFERDGDASTQSVNVNLNASGYATFSGAFDFTVSGATAYQMALNESEKSILGTVVNGKIPAGEGVLLKGEAGATVTITLTTDAEALTGNDLKGSTKSDGTTADKPTYCYVLSGDTFVSYDGDELVPNKAYFAATKNLSADARAFTITFEDGETTSVADVRGKMADVRGEYFDLQGRCVAQPSKGLYIVNGKKVVIK